MEIKHLQTFLTLSDVRNFTRTAEQLHYAQSYVSTLIQQLEEELDTQLFERLGKKINLTADGKSLIPYAKKMLALSANLEKQFSKESHGTIVIGATESICIHRLPEIISAFKSAHPDIELLVRIIDSPDFSSLLMDSQLDLALELNQQNQHTSFITEALLEEEIGVFAVADFELTQKNDAFIEDFADVPLLLTSKECVYRNLFEEELKAAQIIPKIVFETSSVEAIKQTAISGLGVCVLPLIAVKDELEKGTLVRINYQTNYKMMTQLIYHKDKWLSDYLKDFIHVIRTVIA